MNPETYRLRPESNPARVNFEIHTGNGCGDNNDCIELWSERTWDSDVGGTPYVRSVEVHLTPREAAEVSERLAQLVHEVTAGDYQPRYSIANFWETALKEYDQARLFFHYETSPLRPIHRRRAWQRLTAARAVLDRVGIEAKVKTG